MQNYPVKMGEKKNDEEEVKKKKEEQEAAAEETMVLKVDMHCEACARKISKSLKGVEEVTADYKASKVVVKGKAADPLKVCERIQKKSGKKVEIISPLPKPQQEAAKQRGNKDEEPPSPEEEKKEDVEPPAVVTVVLNMRMHCEACARGLQKRIRKIQGVESVETVVQKDQVIVKGIVDPVKLIHDVFKRTRKQASIVKEEEKKKEDEEKKEEGRDEEMKDGENKVEEEDGGGKKSDIWKTEYWPSRYHTEFAYATPEIFSDENPNACIVM